MTVWVIIILALGVFLISAPQYIIDNDMVPKLGLVISLIALGILVRMFKLSRRGEREKMAKKLRELETQGTPAAEPKAPATPK